MRFLRSIAACPLALATSLAAAVALAPLAARAQDASVADGAEAPAPTEAELADARHSFEVATEAFDRGDYETAAEEFRAAYERLRHPDLLFNLYLAEERVGRHAEAADALARYLADATIDDAAQRALLEQRLARLRVRVERTRAGEAVEPAHSETSGDAPIEMAAWLALASRAGGGPGPAAPPPPEPSTAMRDAGIGLLIAGGVLAASFGVFAALSEVEDQRLASSCGRDAGMFCRDDELGALLAYDVVADVSWIAAALSASIGLVLVLAAPSAPSSEGSERSLASVRLVPFASPGSAGVTLGARL